MKINFNKELALSLNDTYLKAYPYPHVSIDNFIDKEDIKECVSEMGLFNSWGFDPSEYSAQYQQKNFFYPWDQGSEEIKETLSRHAPTCWKYLQYFNSSDFLSILEDLTGIKNLIPDNDFVGGGFHRIESGGRLSIHSDYNLHVSKKIYRRINLLVYLNEEWEEEWGGSLQLWKKDMSELITEFYPYAGKAIIFNTNDDSLHGHPHPLNTPIGKNRLSFALYYFTEDRPENEKSDHVSAQWYSC